jgi:predicted nuclease with TOPRIM domain
MSASQIAGWVLVGALAGAAACYVHANWMAVVMLSRATQAFRKAAELKEPYIELQKDHIKILQELRELTAKYTASLQEHTQLLREHLKVQEEYTDLLRTVRTVQDGKSPGSGKVT